MGKTLAALGRRRIPRVLLRGRPSAEGRLAAHELTRQLLEVGLEADGDEGQAEEPAPEALAAIAAKNEKLPRGERIEEQTAIIGRKYDSAFALLIKHLIPTGLRGFMLAAILGAVMSSLASMLNAASTIFTMDLFKEYIHKTASQKTLVLVGRLGVGVFVVMGCIMSLLLDNPAFGGIFKYVQEFQGFISPGILAVFVFGLLVHKAPAGCGVVGLVVNPIVYGLLKVAAPNLAWATATSPDIPVRVGAIPQVTPIEGPRWLGSSPNPRPGNALRATSPPARLLLRPCRREAQVALPGVAIPGTEPRTLRSSNSRNRTYGKEGIREAGSAEVDGLRHRHQAVGDLPHSLPEERPHGGRSPESAAEGRPGPTRHPVHGALSMFPEGYRRLLILLVVSYLLTWVCVEAVLGPADFQSLGASPTAQSTDRTVQYGVLAAIVFAILAFSTPVVVYKYANRLDRDDWVGLLMPLLIMAAAFVFPPAGLAILLLKRGPVAPVSPLPGTPTARSESGEPKDWSQVIEYMTSAERADEFREALVARDQASRDEWIRQGCPGAGQSHQCKMCGSTAHGEETVIEEQRRAIYEGAGGPLAAQQWEMSCGYRCKSCGSEYCKRCLEEKAPGNVYGGKSCPHCGGLFEVMHG